MAKHAVTQYSYALGELREELLRADDIEARNNSLRTARNVLLRGTRTAQERLGTRYVIGESHGIPEVFGIRMPSEEDFQINIWAARLSIMSSAGTEIFISNSVTFDQPSAWAVVVSAKQVIVGSKSMAYTLTYTGGSWSIADFAFDPAPGDELAQPYWSFVPGISLTPSARTGSITVTASAPLFSAAWVGMRIRYAYREILITAYTDSTHVTGTVQSELPPTFRITMSSVVGFLPGNIVIGETTGFQGLIVAVSGSDIDVLTLNYFAGPDSAETLTTTDATAVASKRASAKKHIPGDFTSSTGSTSSATIISPAASPIWDEPLVSPVRGYPGSATMAAGRVFFCAFPQALDAVAGSSARGVFDWKVGSEDDDGFARAIGDDTPVLRHVVSAGDVIILTDRGSYLISLLDGAALTPSSFAPILFDSRGASKARPARLDDAVVFAENNAPRVLIARLSGNIYKKWIVQSLSTMRSHLFSQPAFLCGPAANSIYEDKYLFVGNDDGTMAVMSWVDALDVESVGFVLWETEGTFERAFTGFGEYRFVVTRDVAGVDKVFHERASSTALMDCQVVATGAITSNLEGATLHRAGAGWYGGLVTITGGAAPDADTYPDDAVAGFNFVSTVGLWPANLVQHPKAGLRPARVTRVAATVMHTGVFQIRCNNWVQEFGGYDFGEDLSLPAQDVTKTYRCSVVGRRDYPVIEISKPLPGNFQVLSTTQEVAL